MKPDRTLLGPCALAALVATLTLLAGEARSGSAAAATRLVAASIAVDGQVVLRASTSDDGHPDADEVWGYLLERLEFQPTEAFASLGIDPSAESATLGWLRGSETAHLGEPPSIAVEVAYGGQDAPFRLGLVREAGRTSWRVAPETVRRRFPHRRITRSEAARLSDPRRRE